MQADQQTLSMPAATAVTPWGWKGWLLVSLLVAAVFLVYYPAWWGNLLWDDNAHVTQPELRSWEGLRRIWFELGATPQYYPLLHSFFWVQHQLWGSRTLGYHLVNIALHAAVAVLVALVLRRLKIPGALLAAAVFALHPVQVESVAWITEQKNTLSAVFYLAAALVYLRFDQTRRIPGTVPFFAPSGPMLADSVGGEKGDCPPGATWSAGVPPASASAGETPALRGQGEKEDCPLHVPLSPWSAHLAYTLALALFLLGLLSKTVTATLPAALLVVFWWQRGRLSWRRDVLPLVPFFVLGAAAGVLTAWVEYKLIGAEGAEYEFTLVERFLIAGRVIWFYLGKLLWPAELIFIYPRWNVSQAVWWQYLFPVGAVLLAAVLWSIRGRTRAPLAAVLFFGGTLFPVLGFFNVYPFRYSLVADHFQYLAGLGMIALGSAGVTLLLARSGLWTRTAGRAICLTLLSILGILSWQQSKMYADAEKLYRTTIERNPDCWMAYNNLGSVLTKAGKFREAIEHYHHVLRLKPDDFRAHYNLGYVFTKIGKVQEAIEHYYEALRLKPDDANAHNNLGVIMSQTGKVPEAIEHYRRALSAKRDFPDAHNNLGIALEALDKIDEAIQHYRQALRFRPDFAEGHNNLGNALLKLGKIREAIEHYRLAVRLKPDYAAAHYALGNVLASIGETQQAIEHYRELLRLTPDAPAVLNNLAWLLATSEPAQGGDPARAVQLAERACELGGREKAHCLDTLAAAYAAAGRLDDAVTTAERAVQLAESAGQEPLATLIRARLELYRQRRPYRESPRSLAQPDP